MRKLRQISEIEPEGIVSEAKGAVSGDLGLRNEGIRVSSNSYKMYEKMKFKPRQTRLL